MTVVLNVKPFLTARPHFRKDFRTYDNLRHFDPPSFKQKYFLNLIRLKCFRNPKALYAPNVPRSLGWANLLCA